MMEKRRLGRPPKSASLDRREAILDAALDLFSQHGYNATSIRQIAEQVGVSDPALYSHFNSKSEILETLFETHGPKAVFSATENLDLELGMKNPKAFAREALNALAERWFQPAENKFFRLLLLENLAGHVDEKMSITAIQAPLRLRLLQLASWLISTGRAINVKPEWMVTQFVDTIAAIRTEVATSPGKHNVETIKKRLSEHLDNFCQVFLPSL